MATFGVAVGLPDPAATFLQDTRRAAGDRLADGIGTHVTLLPPTVVPAGQVGDIERHLAAVAARHRRFSLEVGQVGTFRPVSPVQFLCVTRGAQECAALAASIRSGPLARDLDFPYHPHVTIAQQVPDAALDAVGRTLADYRLTFDVASFQLSEQASDGSWRVIRSFVLGGGTDAPDARDIDTGDIDTGDIDARGIGAKDIDTGGLSARCAGR